MKLHKKRQENHQSISSAYVLILSLIILICAPILIYLLVQCIRFWISPAWAVGTSEAWIGFAGSIISGCITMLVLYFSLRFDRIEREKEQQRLQRPVLIGRLHFDRTEALQEISIPNCTNDYGQQYWTIENITDNVANDVCIQDEYFIVPGGIEECGERFDDLSNVGISIMTVRMVDHWLLAPHDKQSISTNVCLSVTENGEYSFPDHAYFYRHVFIISYSDMTRQNHYTTRFEFQIALNIDIKNEPHFFVEDERNTDIFKLNDD